MHDWTPSMPEVVAEVRDHFEQDEQAFMAMGLEAMPALRAPEVW